MAEVGNGTVLVDVQCAFESGFVPDVEEIRNWVRSAILGVKVHEQVEVSIRIVDEAEGRTLNRDYRDKDGATNVLSFPAGESVLPEGMSRPLGDIVICGPVVQRESTEQGKPVADHWAHMLVHGTLHLLGYDHEIESDAEKMEALETRILAGRGVGDPYAV
jgi:probable rRNA maturation factor